MGLTRRRAVWENMCIGGASALGDDGHASRKGQDFGMDKNLEDKKCVYCVNANAETWDHVPPKGIFAKDNRDDLIRVPACFNCNNSFSKDDDWLLQIIATNAEFQEFPGIGEVTDRGLRAVSRPESRGLLESFVANFTDVELWANASGGSGGVYIGKAPAIQFDGDRLKRIIRRIVRGLFWNETRRVLPEDHVVHPFRLAKQKTHDAQDEIERLIQAGHLTFRSIAGGAFEYYYCIIFDAPNASMWVLRFYLGGSLECVAWTKKESGDA